MERDDEALHPRETYKETHPQEAALSAPYDNASLENGAAMRDTIFDELVSGENDVIGLLAYSLSMQNKRDWLAAFQAEAGRPPTAAEMRAYDIGEKIERRLATYRKLAEHALSGNSFWASASLTPVSELPDGYGAASMQPSAARSMVPNPSAPGASASSQAAPQAPSRSVGSKLTLAGGVFIVLLAAAYAARHWMGV